MKFSQAIKSSIRYLSLILSGTTLACLNENYFDRCENYIDRSENYLDPLVGPAYCFEQYVPEPLHYPPPVPRSCNDAGLNVTLSLSVNKVNPLNLPGEGWYHMISADQSNIYNHVNATTSIHNTNPYPVTFEWTNSPVDDLAGGIGVFRLYCQPNGRHIPVAYAIVQRYWRGEEFRVRIPARETIESTHVLRMMTDALRQLPDGKYVLRVEGYWRHFQNENSTVLGEVAEKVYPGRYCFRSQGVEIEVQRP